MTIIDMPHKICFSRAEAELHMSYAVGGLEDGDTARIVPNADESRFIVEIIDPNGKRVMLF